MRIPVVFLCLWVGIITGCARTAKVTAVEGGTDIPYESLGTLEVREKVSRVSAAGAWYTGVEVVTLSLADTPARDERYKKKLRDLLAERAKTRYQADGVIGVRYWPDPSMDTFPQGYVYARGEMIKYTRFPGQGSDPAKT